MAERGVTVAPSTISPSGQLFVPECETRWNACRQRIGTSWRADETYLLVNTRWHDLSCAVDNQGRPVHCLLSEDRGMEAAPVVFQNARATNDEQAPRKVTLDGHVPSHPAR